MVAYEHLVHEYIYIDDHDYLTEPQAARLLRDLRRARAVMAENRAHWEWIKGRFEVLCAGYGGVDTDMLWYLTRVIPDVPEDLEHLHDSQLPMHAARIHSVMTERGVSDAFHQYARYLREWRRGQAPSDLCTFLTGRMQSETEAVQRVIAVDELQLLGQDKRHSDDQNAWSFGDLVWRFRDYRV